MSASSKKKLRNEQEAAKLTERQLAEQKEAKKLKLYTAIFVVVLAALLVVALWVGISKTVANSGIREKNTVAMTVGGREISNAELNYFYIDSINNFYSQNGSYATLFGLDPTAPLNEQVYDEATGETWADYFLESAKSTAQSVYAMADAAKAAGHTLSETDAATAESAVSSAELYAALYGYGDAEHYLKAMYGNGASEEGYRAYIETSLLADSYYAAYGESLTYEDAALRAVEAENFDAFSSFTYNYYYLSSTKFLEGGTTNENGTTTYSDEEKAASVKAAEEAAKSLVSEEITTVEALDAAINALPINAETSASSTLYEDTDYSSIDEDLVSWLADDARKEGDMTYIANTTTSTDEEGNETSTVGGYFVVYFHSANDNNFPMKSVRHILVGFEGGTTGENGVTTYSDEEKAAAKAEAEEILNQWKSGDATEESFAALANEKSDDGDGTTGGLYENIVPSSNYVENFLNWALADHAVGDTGIVETEYGYHVMYFAGDSEQTYRDYMIQSKLASEDVAEWYESILESAAVTDGNTSYIRKDLVMNSNG